MGYGKYSRKHLPTGVCGEAVLILVAIFALVMASPAIAKGKNVGDTNGTLLLEQCRGSVDTKKNPRDQNNVNQSWGNSCCSKEKGYCIECLRGKNYCTKYPYLKFPNVNLDRTNNNSPNQVVAPKAPRKKIRNQRKLPGGTVIAPIN